jgi:hypothetical protein
MNVTVVQGSSEVASFTIQCVSLRMYQIPGLTRQFSVNERREQRAKRNPTRQNCRPLACSHSLVRRVPGGAHCRVSSSSAHHMQRRPGGFETCDGRMWGNGHPKMSARGNATSCWTCRYGHRTRISRIGEKMLPRWSCRSTRGSLPVCVARHGWLAGWR